MLVYDKQLPLLDTSVEAEEVVLLAVRGRVVDPAFRNNYLAATGAADAGKVGGIVVKVDVTADGFLHTLDAVNRALYGAKLHESASFFVDVPVGDIGSAKVTQLLAALRELETFRDVPEAEAMEVPVEAPAVERKPRGRPKKDEPAAADADEKG